MNGSSRFRYGDWSMPEKAGYDSIFCPEVSRRTSSAAASGLLRKRNASMAPSLASADSRSGLTGSSNVFLAAAIRSVTHPAGAG